MTDTAFNTKWGDWLPGELKTAPEVAVKSSVFEVTQLADEFDLVGEAEEAANLEKEDDAVAKRQQPSRHKAEERAVVESEGERHEALRRLPVYRKLAKRYGGILGLLKVGAGVVTVGPLFFKARYFSLHLSVATLFYIAYHAFNLSIWWVVHQSRDRDLEINTGKLKRAERLYVWGPKWLGWVVLLFIVVTLLGNASIDWGETQIGPIPLPDFVHKFLGR